MRYLGKQSASALAAGPSGVASVSVATNAALSGGPALILPVAGSYVVQFGASIQSTSAGLFQGEVALMKNGVTVGASALTVGSNTFDGGAVSGQYTLVATTGDILTLNVITINTVTVSVGHGWISARL